MSSTLGTSLATGITLTTAGAYTTPFTITATGAITASTPNGVYASRNLTGTAILINQGYILGASIGVDFPEGGTLLNAGTIIGNSRDGVFLSGAGSDVTNTGVIVTHGSGVGAALNLGGTLTNGAANALISGATGIYAAAAANIANAGTIQGLIHDGILLGQGGTISNAGAITGGAYAIDFVKGINNRLILEPGATFTGNIVNTPGGGSLELTAGAGAIANFGASFTGFSTIAFDPGADWRLSATASQIRQPVITGFAPGSSIDITNFIATGYGIGHTGLTLANSAQSLILDITLPPTTPILLLPDGASGTLIEEVTCFARGTRIATGQGEIPVEALRIGDLVKTPHAGPQKIKWIGHRAYAAPFCNHPKLLPIRIAAHALGRGIPARDLYLSPGHALAINGALIHAAALINGSTITQLPHAELVEYFHIELEAHDVIFAESTPVETFLGEYFRPQFQNAAEFHTLYPGSTAPEHHCLPPLTQGLRLAGLKSRLSRASLRPGPLIGHVDSLTPICAGWAIDLANPTTPVTLDVFSAGRRLARIEATLSRPDVLAAGHPTQTCGFEFPTTAPVTLRRAADGAPVLKQAVAFLKKSSAKNFY